MARYAYVLVSGDGDRYAAMCLVSALSVRGIDPDARISLFTDEATAARLRSGWRSLLKIVDDVSSVPFVDTPQYTSRFLKTTLLPRMNESFIYLDVDTLVVRPFSKRLARKCDIQCALDRSVQFPTPGFPQWVIPHYQQLGWRYPTARYFNCGVMMVRANSATQRLFEKWHRRWRDFHSVCGRYNDQPAFNSAIDATGVNVATLPLRYNAIVRISERFRWRARVLHFYADVLASEAGTEYHELVRRAQAGEALTVEDVRRGARRRWPMAHPDSICRHLVAGSFAGAMKIWWNRMHPY